jgi:hypothetical protein
MGLAVLRPGSFLKILDTHSPNIGLRCFLLHLLQYFIKNICDLSHKQATNLFTTGRAMIILFLILSTVSLIIRVYTSAFIRRRIRPSDCKCLLIIELVIDR